MTTTGYLLSSSTDTIWTTFTPTVTLVGGVGNTVPVYSTNTGRYTTFGNVCWIEVYLTGDGGAEGAGTGTVNIALPVTVATNAPLSLFPAGYALNSTTGYLIYGQSGGLATTVSLNYFNAATTTATFTGADQNNTTRSIRLQFFYEI